MMDKHPNYRPESCPRKFRKYLAMVLAPSAGFFCKVVSYVYIGKDKLARLRQFDKLLHSIPSCLMHLTLLCN